MADKNVKRNINLINLSEFENKLPHKFFPIYTTVSYPDHQKWIIKKLDLRISQNLSLLSGLK